MAVKKRRLTDRRRFISMVSGILSGLLLSKPGSAQTTKSEIKQFVANIETDLLERSRPSKHPAVAWEHYGDGIRLYRKNQLKNIPFCAINRVVAQRVTGGPERAFARAPAINSVGILFVAITDGDSARTIAVDSGEADCVIIGGRYPVARGCRIIGRFKGVTQHP